MNVSLTPELEKFVKDKVASGRYTSSSEVVREALRVLEENEHLNERRLEQLKKEVALGIEQANQGKLKPGKEVIDRILRKNKPALEKAG